MIIQEILSFTATDGYEWKLHHYSPSDSMSQGTLVCLHGIQSHAGWYERSCRYFAEQGWDVCFLDRRGSGVNQEARGDCPSFRRLLDDVGEFLQEQRQQHPERRVILHAVSWGGKPALALLKRHPGLVDGLVLLCPGFFPIVSPPLRQRLRILGARLIRPRRRFPVPLDDPYLFTENEKWHEHLRTDPLSLREATARFFVESVRLDIYLKRVSTKIGVPILLVLASEDRIIDNAKTRRWIERFPNVTTLEYPGAHHTLEFEEQPEPVFANVHKWMSEL